VAFFGHESICELVAGIKADQAGSQSAVAYQRTANKVSFKFTCQCIANPLAGISGALSPSDTPRRRDELQSGIGRLFIVKRPRPSRPRAVQISKTRFPVNRHAGFLFIEGVDQMISPTK
jgi:hypothetical protein